ncbi:hypothetical protein ONS96_010689 [Cadophora gregata f. sp. sojae]|nr:hypothetical protein ONS96_010689 [Cadophora gregata f. sp. sojae]
MDMDIFDPEVDPNVAIAMNLNTHPPYTVNQRTASYEEQMDRRLRELTVASQSWATVEPEMPAEDGNSNTVQQHGQQGSRELSADWFGRVDQQGDTDSEMVSSDPLDQEDDFSFEEYLNDLTTPDLGRDSLSNPGPATNSETTPNLNVDPEFQEALNREAQRRRPEAYQEYRRNSPRQPQPSAEATESSVFQFQAGSSRPGSSRAESAFSPGKAPPPAPVPGRRTLQARSNSQPPTSFTPFQPRRPQPPSTQRPAQPISSIATWSWDGSRAIDGPDIWPFKNLTAKRLTPGDYTEAIFANMQNTGNCDEMPRYQAIPDHEPFSIHISSRILCGETPVKDCGVAEHAQGEHTVLPFLTCLKCHVARRDRVPRLQENLERRKVFLCGGCVEVVRGEEEAGRVEVRKECLCRESIDNTWLCHMHGREVEEEFASAVLNAEAALMRLGVRGRCIACAAEPEDDESGVWSCMICRDWVWSNPGNAGGPRR